MNAWWVYGIGFLAQILFSSRLIVQWVQSEKAHKVVTPTIFWTLSLVASLLLLIYGILRDDFAIMLGQSLTYYIYIRNLQFKREWQKFPLALRIVLLFMLPILLMAFYSNSEHSDFSILFHKDNIATPILILGIISQLLFTFRFIYQWIYSEKHYESTLPKGFWMLSLAGALLILTYAVLREDPVLLLGHLMGAFIYTRNLMLLKKENA